MARMINLFRQGRVQKLRLFQWLLVTATIVVVLLQTYGLVVMYRNSGSVTGVFERGWRYR